MVFALLVYELDISALQAFYKVKYRPVSMASLWLLNRNFVIKSYSICAGVAKVRILTSVIFYCFESSVCSHFVIWSASLLTSLFISLIQCCSSIFLSLGLRLDIVHTIPGESLYCTFIQSSLGPIWSNVLLIFLFQKAFYFHSVFFLSLYVIGDNLFSFLIRDNQAQLEPGYLARLFKRWIALSTG